MKQTSLFLDFLFKMLNSALLLLILQVLASQGTVTWTGHMLQSTLSCSHVARYAELLKCCKVYFAAHRLQSMMNISYVTRYSVLCTAHRFQGTVNYMTKYALIFRWAALMLQGMMNCSQVARYSVLWTAHRLQGMMNCSQFAKRSKQHRKVSGTIQMSHIEMN